MLLRTFSVLLFTICLSLGIGYVQSSWNSEIYVTSEQMGFIRDVATEQKSSDTFRLHQKFGEITSPMRMLRGLKIINNTDFIEIKVGHFIVKEKFGSKQFACQKYDRVLLVFEADGFAQSGERPRLEIEADCEASEDLNYIKSINFPVAKILAEPAAEGEFDFKEPNPVTVRVANIADEWPMYWTLTSIRLLDTRTQGQDFVISLNEIRQNFANPIQMIWVK